MSVSYFGVWCSVVGFWYFKRFYNQYRYETGQASLTVSTESSACTNEKNSCVPYSVFGIRSSDLSTSFGSTSNTNLTKFHREYARVMLAYERISDIYLGVRYLIFGI